MGGARESLVVLIGSLALAGCLEAKQGGVMRADVATADTSAAVDTTTQLDSAAVVDSQTLPSTDTSAGDTAATWDTLHTADTTVVGEVDGGGPDGCCLVGGLALGHYEAIDAAACEARCGSPFDAAVCADPPVCCELPDAHVVEETTSGCAALHGSAISGDHCWASPTICCAWSSGASAIATEVEADRCAASGGHEVIGDRCWDRDALGEQCCALTDGTVHIEADYQCEPEGGAVIPWLDCWQPPESGVCCAIRCGGALFSDDAAACGAAGGSVAAWDTCDPAQALEPQ